MKKREITEPERAGPHLGCIITVLILAPTFCLWALSQLHWFLILISLVLLVILSYMAYGFTLSVYAARILAESGYRGILVYSESPNWQAYIEQNWLPKLNNMFVVLNWSQRKQWNYDLPVRLFKHFVGIDKNFNPAVILLRHNRWPIVYRFYPAFRDAKHGDHFALNRLESALFRELDINAA